MEKQTLQARYGAKTDEQLAQLAQTAFQLTPLAQSVLAEEIKKRSLGASITLVTKDATEEAQTTLLVFSDTTQKPAGWKEYKGALKVFYISKASMRPASYLSWFLGAVCLLLLLINAKFLVFFAGIAFILLGYYFWNISGRVAQLVLYPDYLLFIPASNIPKNYADFYHAFIDREFSRVEAKEITEIIRLNEFFNLVAIAIRIKGHPNPIPLLLQTSGREADDIYEWLNSTYTNPA